MPTGQARHTPLVLIIRDGWGRNPHPEHDAFNAVKLAKTPVDARLMREYPSTLVRTSGEDVGLPDGTMGNSEVGHQNIGAGRVVDQDSVRITKACRGDGGGLAANGALTAAIGGARERGAFVHLMGICSDAGVHGLLSHLYGVLELCRSMGQVRVALHLFTDGRDSGPHMGREFVRQVEAACDRIGVGAVASVIGRYWALDRDNRWERVERAYRCLVGRGDPHGPDAIPVAHTAVEAVQRYYEHPSGATMRGDEFVTPTMIGRDHQEAMVERVAPHDAVIFYNYRGDRPRELVSAFVLPDAAWASVPPSPDSGRRGFDRGTRLNLDFVTMTAYSSALDPHVRVAFPKLPRMANIGGEYLARCGLKQFRCAETEKYPHVTFFFNDYREEPFPGERRENPQSPKVATYDLKPEMAAAEVRDAVLRRLGAPDCEDVLVVNFANGDMVGHTGSLPAAIKACEVVDECVGAIVEATLARSGSLIVTADHGNAEQMWDPVGNSPHTAHTTYEVPLIVVGAAFRGRRLREGGRLADIVPTALDMMGMAAPPEMTGRSLLV